jgi:hypothetical protein
MVKVTSLPDAASGSELQKNIEKSIHLEKLKFESEKAKQNKMGIKRELL